MTPDEARHLLTAERAATVVRLERLEDEVAGIVAASRDTNADDEHDPEGATVAFERSQTSALAARAREVIAEVDAALARVAAGTYGTCETCGGLIADRRLSARPTARRHVACPVGSGASGAGRPAGSA